MLNVQKGLDGHFFGQKMYFHFSEKMHLCQNYLNLT